ncbi:glycine receptor subunit alphaZ1 [Caerostris darwini]|uniref:Glycine receptor subunit alphaZ1 n=1 Tax=Caerostris darwini TaxID=1538125 RepID=A0AAV4SKS8_9ARAC|nr:glycine receptor subunit alphaZ1 [Caerostris darwini]
MDFRLHGYLRTHWIDERITINSSIVNNRCTDHLWIPDVIFEQAKVIQTFGKQNSYFYISKDKKLSSAERYSFKIGCLMFFENYPFDTQHCLFSIVLMSTSDKEVKLMWDDGTGYPSVMLARKIEPLQFSLGQMKTYETTNGYNGANYTYLYLNITLIRRLTGSIVNIYAPSTLIVAVSWVTFWLSLEAAPARVALSITSLLTLCTQAQQNKSQLPPLNYITAVDIWLFTCIFMVFSTLVEFAISYNSQMNELKIIGSPSSKQHKCIYSIQKLQSWVTKKKTNNEVSEDTDDTRRTPEKQKYCCCWSLRVDVNKLDAISQKLFPFSFLIFAIIYWVHYLKIYNQS